ncbi:MAG: DUF6941 family protein [Acidimicrobiia bacterium]|jgi:hypothetical protein
MDFESLEFDESAFDSPAFEPSVDFAILADAAQAIAGKLFLLGGGWDTLRVGGFPARHHTMAIGLRVRIPWTWTGRPMTLAIDLQDEDGGSLFSSGPLRHGFEVGRPPGAPEGSDIGLVRAFTFNHVPFPKAGGYAFAISLNDAEVDRLRFNVFQHNRPTE